MEHAGVRKTLSPSVKWNLVLRAYSFPASILPVLATAAAAFTRGADTRWLFLPPALCVALCFHAGANLANDYYDHLSGADRMNGDVSTWAISWNLISPARTLFLARCFVAAGLLAGIPLALARGPVLLLIGLAGAAGGYFYTAPPVALKRRGLGEAAAFILMGPLLFMGSWLTLTGRSAWEILPESLPAGFLVAAIMCGNNLRDLEADRAAGLKTLAVRLGYRTGRWSYGLLGLGAYGSHLALVLTGRAAAGSLLFFATAPFYFSIAANLIHGRMDRLRHVDMKTAQIYMLSIGLGIAGGLGHYLWKAG